MRGRGRAPSRRAATPPIPRILPGHGGSPRASARGYALADGRAHRRTIARRRTAPARIRVLLVDDHAVVRRGLLGFFELLDDIEVVGEAENGRRGRRAGRGPHARRRAHGPADAGDGRHRRDGEIKARLPGGRGRRADELHRGGARSTAALEAGRHRVPAQGRRRRRRGRRGPPRPRRRGPPRPAGRAPRWPTASAAAREAARRTRAARPTASARSWRSSRKGHSNKEIATRLLDITERTARTHVSNILGKLDLASRTQAALWAIEHEGRMSVRRGTAPSSAGRRADRRDRPRRIRDRAPVDRRRPARRPPIVFLHGDPAVACAVGARSSAGSPAVPVRRGGPAGPRHRAASRSPSTRRRDACAAAIDAEAAGGRAILVGPVARRLRRDRRRGGRTRSASRASCSPAARRSRSGAIGLAVPGLAATLERGAAERARASRTARFFRLRYGPPVARARSSAGGFWSSGGAAALRALVGAPLSRPRLARLRTRS